MACTVNPTGSGELGGCYDEMVHFNPTFISSMWAATNPECASLIHVGEWIQEEVILHNPGVISCRESETNMPPPWGEDTRTHIKAYYSESFDGYCSELQSDNAITMAIEEWWYVDFTWNWYPGSPSCPHPYDGGWTQIYTRLKFMNFYILINEEDEPDCPPGATYNSQGALCEPLPGWEEDPNNPGSYIPVYCIEIITHNQTIDAINYIVNIVPSDSGEPVTTEDVIVFLSYNGSTATNGIEFTAPSSVIIKKNTYSTTLQVELLGTDYEKTIIINGTATLSNGVFAPSCGPNTVLINDSVSYINEPVPDSYISCCDWVPKDFIEWSNGWNMNQLIPPNER